jgi:hypothetical protein
MLPHSTGVKQATRPNFIIPASNSVTRPVAERNYQYKAHEDSEHKFEGLKRSASHEYD